MPLIEFNEIAQVQQTGSPKWFELLKITIPLIGGAVIGYQSAKRTNRKRNEEEDKITYEAFFDELEEMKESYEKQLESVNKFIESLSLSASDILPANDEVPASKRSNVMHFYFTNRLDHIKSLSRQRVTSHAIRAGGKAQYKKIRKKYHAILITENNTKELLDLVKESKYKSAKLTEEFWSSYIKYFQEIASLFDQIQEHEFLQKFFRMNREEVPEVNKVKDYTTLLETLLSPLAQEVDKIEFTAKKLRVREIITDLMVQIGLMKTLRTNLLSDLNLRKEEFDGQYKALYE